MVHRRAPLARHSPLQEQSPAHQGRREDIIQLLQGSIQRDVYYARARSYPNSLEAALFPDNVPVDVYNTLIEEGRSQQDWDLVGRVAEQLVESFPDSPEALQALGSAKVSLGEPAIAVQVLTQGLSRFSYRI